MTTMNQTHFYRVLLTLSFFSFLFSSSMHAQKTPPQYFSTKKSKEKYQILEIDFTNPNVIAAQPLLRVGDFVVLKIKHLADSLRILSTSFSFENKNEEGKKDFMSQLQLSKTSGTMKTTGLDALSEIDSVVFFPRQVENKDVTKIKFELNRGGQIPETFTYDFLNRGGFKVDFSVGFFLTGLRDQNIVMQNVKSSDTTFYTQNFQKTDSILDIKDVSKNRIVVENNGDFRVGLGALSHFYWRTGRRHNWSITTGILIDNDSNVNYALGGSLILGLEQRLLLSAGGVAGKVKRLPNIYTVGQILESNISSISPIQVWDWSWFFGITYNFGS